MCVLAREHCCSGGSVAVRYSKGQWSGLVTGVGSAGNMLQLTLVGTVRELLLFLALLFFFIDELLLRSTVLVCLVFFFLSNFS